jgi:Rho-binding antiterminator
VYIFEGMKEEVYVPINCYLYDQLEAFAVLKTAVTVVYDMEGESTLLEHACFTDFVTQKDGEYGYISSNENNFKIRLDKLVSLNGSNVKDEFGHSCKIPNKK